MNEYRDRIKELRRVPASDLKINPKNWRTHPDSQSEAMKGVLSDVGWADAVLARETPDGLELIDGHLRKEIAPDELVPVLVLDVDEAEADKILLTHDPLAAMAEQNTFQLDQLIQSVETDSEGLASMIADLAIDLDPPEVIEDVIPEPPAKPITKSGELILLGDHRLLCGDSTIADDVARLMDGNKADLCFTSPPYALGENVSLSNNVAMKKKGNAYNDHEDTSGDWSKLMDAFFLVSKSAVANCWVINVQPLAGNKRNLIHFIDKNTKHLVDIATWDKTHSQPSMASGVLNSQFEWLIIFSKTTDATRTVPLSSWRGTVANIYSGPPQRNNESSSVHAATMPIHLPCWVMSTLCDDAKSTYDPFLGTGTTLIAAEQLGRKCYGVEIDPAYCDVIVQRWENLTGEKARRQ